MYDCNTYILYIFVFTAMIHFTVCRDCIHTFVSFQTVLLFVSVTGSLVSTIFSSWMKACLDSVLLSSQHKHIIQILAYLDSLYFNIIMLFFRH